MSSKNVTQIKQDGNKFYINGYEVSVIDFIQYVQNEVKRYYTGFALDVDMDDAKFTANGREANINGILFEVKGE